MADERAVRSPSPDAPAHLPPARAAAAARAAGERSTPQRVLARMGLQRDIDLALHLPLRYEDETRITPIAEARDGQTVQVEGVVQDCRIDTQPRRQLVARVRDGSGVLVLRFLHFYPSHQKSLSPGARVRVRGELRHGFFGREMVHPALRGVVPDAPLPTTLTPVYPAAAGLPQAYLRKAVAAALARAPLHELLPPEALPPGLPSLRAALAQLHHPPPCTDAAALEDRSHPAWQRLKFEELLAQQLSQLGAQRERASLRAPRLVPKADGIAAGLRTALPFALTSAQQRVVAEIEADLARCATPAEAEAGIPMHRLLQGDVGSGKTVVAALAAAVAIDNGWQCALMAPTELLAEQHFRKLVQWLEPLLAPLGLGIAWLTGSRKGRVRRQMLDAVASGQAALVVGTHAVIQDDVCFARLALAVVDEQHRFGVAQRLALRRKLADSGGAPGLEPHLLMMSATPIPRTLAMAYFADLDVSTLDELPPGRLPVLTKLFAEHRRDEVMARIAAAVAAGRQVYWVCPLIEESETLDLENATAAHQRLVQALPGHAVALLHGRMASADKAAAMAGFVAGHTAVLVATTVIEVGVDVPNASLMVIEHAERFGLSQLHQLRGRVGRGSVSSACVLLYQGPLSPSGRDRLKAMVDTHDGFEIARRDLEIRGPGEFMGARQSGDALLRFADLAEDAPLLQNARSLASKLLANHPESAAAHVARWLDHRADFLHA